MRQRAELTQREAELTTGSYLVFDHPFGGLMLDQVTSDSEVSVWVGGRRIARAGLSDPTNNPRIPTERDILQLRIKSAQRRLTKLKVTSANVDAVNALLEANGHEAP